jgi:hypothetical protein
MATRVTTYSMKNVQATLDGLTVEGFWDGDDAVQVEENADIGSGLVGADGASIFSVSTDNAAQITLRVQHTSHAHRRLTERLARQKALGGGPGFPFDVIDRTSGEGHSADRCYISQAPSTQYGQTASVRVWVLWTGDCTRLALKAING